MGDAGKALQAVFTEVSGLQVEMQVTDYEEGGTNNFVHRLPGRLKVGNITLKHGMTLSNTFLKWCMKTNIGSLQRQNVTVVLFDTVGDVVVRWHFNKAYPVKWTGPQFTADSTAIAIESIELTHEGLTVDPAQDLGSGVMQPYRLTPRARQIGLLSAWIERRYAPGPRTLSPSAPAGSLASPEAQNPTQAQRSLQPRPQSSVPWQTSSWPPVVPGTPGPPARRFLPVVPRPATSISQVAATLAAEATPAVSQYPGSRFRPAGAQAEPEPWTGEAETLAPSPAFGEEAYGDVDEAERSEVSADADAAFGAGLAAPAEPVAPVALTVPVPPPAVIAQAAPPAAATQDIHGAPDATPTPAAALEGESVAALAQTLAPLVAPPATSAVSDVAMQAPEVMPTLATAADQPAPPPVESAPPDSGAADPAPASMDAVSATSAATEPAALPTDAAPPQFSAAGPAPASVDVVSTMSAAAEPAPPPVDVASRSSSAADSAPVAADAAFPRSTSVESAEVPPMPGSGQLRPAEVRVASRRAVRPRPAAAPPPPPSADQLAVLPTFLAAAALERAGITPPAPETTPGASEALAATPPPPGDDESRLMALVRAMGLRAREPQAREPTDASAPDSASASQSAASAQVPANPATGTPFAEPASGPRAPTPPVLPESAGASPAPPRPVAVPVARPPVPAPAQPTADLAPRLASPADGNRPSPGTSQQVQSAASLEHPSSGTAPESLGSAAAAQPADRGALLGQQTWMAPRNRCSRSVRRRRRSHRDQHAVG